MAGESDLCDPADPGISESLGVVMKNRKNKLCLLLLLFVCSLPMAVSFAKYYEEVSLQVTSTGSRPAILIENISTDMYHDRNKTTTYQFKVRNSDTSGQGQVKLQYSLEFHMPVSSGITYSLTKGSTNVSLSASGTTAEGKRIYKTGLQDLPVTAQTDTYTLSAVNGSTRSIAIMDTMKIIVHTQQAAS